MDRVRMGIVGVGNVATLNVPGYVSHERCDLIALCDPRPDVLERRGKEWGVERLYESLDALLADDDVDAVEILSPTPMHADHVIAAARAGKHISVQKPIANSVADGRRMVQTAADAGVVFRVTENCCHYEPLEKAKSLIASGAIGTPTVVRIKTVVGRTDSKFQANLDPAGYTWRFNAREPGRPPVRRRDAQVRHGAVARRRGSAAGPVGGTSGSALLRGADRRDWEYARDDLLGMMEVSYAPDMYIRSTHCGADEFFEIQGTRGFVWVTRLCGQIHDLPSVILYEEDGTRTTFGDVDPDVRPVVRALGRPFRRCAPRGHNPRPRPEACDQVVAALLRRVSGIEPGLGRRPVDDRRVGVAGGVAAGRGEAAARRRGDVCPGGVTGAAGLERER